MSVGYFDAAGLLICTTMTPTGRPDGTLYQSDLPTGAGPNDVYFDVAEETVKQRAALAVNVARNLLSGIPPASVAIVDGQSLVVNDGRIEFEANIEAMVRVLIDHPHFIPQWFQVQTGPEI